MKFVGLLGHGVHLRYDRWIQEWKDDNCLSLMLADGRLAAFPLLTPGDEYYHAQEKLLLRRKQNGHFLLEDYNDNCYYHFNYDQQPAAGVCRLLKITAATASSCIIPGIVYRPSPTALAGNYCLRSISSTVLPR